MYRFMLEMATDRKDCVACKHAIDAAARICPYCGADPESGTKVDTRPIVEAHFPPRGEMTRLQRLLEYFRERQALVVVAVIVTVYILLGAAHQMVARRNADLEATAPAVPLTELADLNDPAPEPQLPIPELDFGYQGNPQTMGVMLIEPGAVAPPPDPAQTTTAAPRTSPPPPPPPQG